MKDDEYALLKALFAARGYYYRPIIESSGINPKRAAYILEKWVGKGIYEYGINLFAGWLTARGREIAQLEMMTRGDPPWDPALPGSSAAARQEH